MSLKDFFTNIRNNRKKKNSEEVLVTQLTNTYLKKKKLGLKDPIDTTVDRIMEIIRQSENPNLAAERILKAAIEQEQMPDRIPEKLSIIISQSKKLSDDIVGNVIDSADTYVSDEFINRVLEDGDLGLKNRLRLIGNVNDEAIIEERVNQEFAILYKMTDQMKDNEIVYRIEAIKDIVRESNSNMDIIPQTEKIIAKKIADNFYDDSKRTTLLFVYSTIISFEKMLEDDIPSLVEEEFKKLEINGEKPDRYRRTDLLKQILSEIGKNVGTKYRESKESTKRFIIPRSKTMQNLAPAEAEEFIRSIQVYSRKTLTKKDLKSITEQMKGIIRNDTTRAMLIVNAMQNMPNIDESVETLTNILSSEQKIRIVFIMEEMGLLDRFEKMSPDTREKALQIIAETLCAKTKSSNQSKSKILSEALMLNNPNNEAPNMNYDEHSL